MEEKIKKVIEEYLESIGVSKTVIDKILKESKEVLLLVLPEVCTLKINRPGSASKQYHIHVTGEAMNFFFNESDLKNNPRQFENDEKQDILLFRRNLENLSACAEKDHGIERKIEVGTMDEIIKTYTHKKVGHKGSQVQISKTRLDDKQFMNLRTCLFTNDVLVFIKLEDGSVFSIGIPNSYFCNTGLSNNNIYGKINKVVEVKGKDRNLRSVNYSTIASFNPDDEEVEDNETKDKSFNLANGIFTRKKRTERHQDIVKIIALDLERSGYSLYENPVDCLATKKNYKPLLFEIKTLDGSDSDERKQVQKAFAQLFYYEEFNIKKYTKDRVEKIAVFESKISDEHILFFKKVGIRVCWMKDDIHLYDEYGLVRF